MALFLDLRAIPTGGFVADHVQVLDEQGRQLDAAAFEQRVQGRDLVLATHGFNVNAASGKRALGDWERLCRLPNPCEYVGVLWPGDSRFLPVLDYPVEGSVAIKSGKLLATFLNEHAGGATSLSLVSHSLGGRTVLQTVRGLQRKVRVLVLMAAAIEDDCLTREYADIGANVERIRVVASEADWVLAAAFPIGNPIGQIIMAGHPYFRRALGRQGPRTTVGVQAQCQTWQIPKGWDYGHLDYLPGSPLDAPFPAPVAVPGGKDGLPRQSKGWKYSWSAGVVGTQFG